MGRFFRCDSGTLGQAKRTPQGGLEVLATLTRTGIFEYMMGGQMVSEYRSPKEVARADSLATLNHAPVTLNHPPGKVTPDNYRAHSVGTLSNDVKLDGANVVGTVLVQDAAAIRAIENGRRDVSCGYHCDVDETPGIVPAGEPDAGRRYDRAQINIVYNHLALVAAGRAGNARLRLDSEGHAINDQERGAESMKTERIDGVDYEIGTPAHQAACARRDAKDLEIKARLDQADKIAAELAQEKKLRADAEEKHKALVAKVKTELAPERMDAAVAARARVVTKATALMGKDFKCDGLTNAQIKSAVCAKAYPKLRLDGASKDTINGLWMAITAEETDKIKTRNDAAEKLLKGTSPMPGQGNGGGNASQVARTPEQARADSITASTARSNAPLALSRRGGAAPSVGGNNGVQSAQMETMK